MENFGVGAGTGGGFETTTKLRVMKYNEAIYGPNRAARKKEVQHECQRMLKMKVFKEVKRSELPRGVKPIDGTWTLKKERN